MSDPASQPHLLERVVAGSESAAREVYDRFFGKLRQLVERQMSRRLKAYEDAEDVVMSALESFFRGIDEQRSRIDHSGALWKLLQTITLHKLIKHEEAAGRQKRGGDREPAHPEMEELLGREPTPSDAAIVVDLVAEVLDGLDAVYGEIVRRRLEGCSEQEIAKQLRLGREEVRYKLRRIRERLNGLLKGDANG